MTTLAIPANRWPPPWRPLTDDAEALAFGRSVNPEVALTVSGELKRELPPGHPLAGRSLLPLGWDTQSKRDFLFWIADATPSLARIHFTWFAESDPRWPTFRIFDNFDEFRRAERNHYSRPWEICRWL